MLNIKEGTQVFYIKNTGIDKLTKTTKYSIETGALKKLYCRLGTEEWYAINDDVVSETCIAPTYDEAVEKMNAAIEAEIKDCEKQIAKLKESIKTYKKIIIKNNNNHKI